MVKLFGTDGIRGAANTFPMDADSILQVAKIAALRFKEHGSSVIIGKDTRVSGYVFESCFVSGVLSLGMDAFLVGPVPTSCISMLTKSLRCAFGVMISASHNVSSDNGIKFFSNDGLKISNEDEKFIEESFASHIDTSGCAFGKARRITDVNGRYVEFVKNTFPSDLSLNKLRIVLDCAHGSVYKVAETIFWELGAEVITINNAPDGHNINWNCGAMHPGVMQSMVRLHNADIGIALDGDGDRLVVADENGDLVDGDQLIASIALLMQQLGKLKGQKVVLTVASSVALERFLHSKGIGVIRTKVGDKEVLRQMMESELFLGAEPSGHVIMREFMNTSDGLIAALQLLHLVIISGTKVSQVTSNFIPIPRVIKNIDLDGNPIILSEKLNKAEKYIAEVLLPDERALVRASGTEKVLRIMAEGNDLCRIKNIVNDLVDIASE